MITRDVHGAGGEVHLVTLRREERRNALDVEHWAQLRTTIGDACRDGARAVIITGAGKTFCAGADLEGLSVHEMGDAVEGTFRAVREAPVPMLAFVNGAAVGAGMQLTLSCDLRVAATAGRFRIPAAQLSLLIHPSTINRLVALAGAGPARAVLIGSAWLSAEHAYDLGLVDRLGGLDAALEWAGEIAACAPLSLQYFKQHLQIDDLPDAEAAYQTATDRILESEDYAEAMAARAERRAPRFTGR